MARTREADAAQGRVAESAGSEQSIMSREDPAEIRPQDPGTVSRAMPPEDHPEDQGPGLFGPPAPAAQIRYHSIDLLRGIAAAGVLVYHYRNFHMPDALTQASTSEFPLYGFLFPFYRWGACAVQCFWMISGFVFAAVYSNRRPSLRQFAVNRFARLYRLHFAPLLATLLLHAWSMSALGKYQIYPHNDGYHFVLNLFLMSAWGLESGYSYNAPIWSVSVEILVYLCFFLMLRILFKKGVLMPVLLVLVAASLRASHVPGLFWGCGAFFFLGSAAFVAVRNRPRLAPFLGGSSIALFPLVLWGLGDRAPLSVATSFLFFGLVVLLGGYDESRQESNPAARLAWIGESTYAIYLLHVPIQIAAMNVIDTCGVDRMALVRRNWFLLVYLLVVLGAARVTFTKFERPLRGLIRRTF